MRASRHWFLSLGGVALLVACDRSLYPGYAEVAEGVHMQLRMLGDGDTPPRPGDSVQVRLRLALHGDTAGSLFSTERWYAGLDAVLPEGCPGVVMINVGDSVSFITSGAHMPWVTMGAEEVDATDSTLIDMEMLLIASGSPAHEGGAAAPQVAVRTAEEEVAFLERYLANSSEKWNGFMGLYYLIDAGKRTADRVQSGELVTIAYTGHFLEDGRLFDDTHGTGQPLTFRLGDPGQVIKGIEIAVHLLPKGGKGRFIVPSELAFGAGGSSGGIVPPYTTVLYSVEILDVKAPEPGNAAMDTTVAL